ncbi:MAG TPA: TonB-dependent receptor, partial [Terriglobales bacterium]|nr:TonB-dependent receptor [Terriglobales bacterium]
NVYGSLSNGFKSGVYNAYSFLDAPVDPENIKAFELGAKAQVGSLTIAAAAFAYDYDDLQLSAYTTVNGLALVTLSNAASAEMRGLELTADGRIAPGFSIGAGISWQPVAKYGSYTNAQVTRPIPGAAGPEIAEVVVPFDATAAAWCERPRLPPTCASPTKHPYGAVTSVER